VIKPSINPLLDATALGKHLEIRISLNIHILNLKRFVWLSVYLMMLCWLYTLHNVDGKKLQVSASETEST
jgi:hypothetical protein